MLAHLSHSEGHCYRTRLDRFMAEARPEFESDDAQMHLDLYRDADPEDAFDHFEEQREINIEFLRDLPPAPEIAKPCTRSTARSLWRRC